MSIGSIQIENYKCFDQASSIRLTSGKKLESLKDDTWLRDVNAASLLSRLFSEISNNRETYSKIRDGQIITKWLTENWPQAFEEVRTCVNDLLKKNPHIAIKSAA